MRYINSRFTYLLTYLLTYRATVRQVGFSQETHLDHYTPYSHRLPTKFHENILTAGRDMLLKQNLTPALDNCHPSETFLRITVQNFKKIAQRTSELLRFNFSLPTFKHALPTAQRQSAVMHASICYSLTCIFIRLHRMHTIRCAHCTVSVRKSVSLSVTRGHSVQSLPNHFGVLFLMRIN